MPNLTIKTKIIIFVVYTLIVAASAVWMVPVKTVTVTKEVQVDKIVYKEREDTQDQTHKTVKSHTETKTDGTRTTDTTITFDNTVKDVKVKDDSKTDNTTTETTKEVTRGDSKVTVLGLAGVNVGTGQVAYGASVSKSILGPVSIGGFAFSNGFVGGGAGLQF